LTKKNMTDLGCKSTISGLPPSKTPEYRVWVQMRYRCGNPNHREFHYYGGRGITVCEAWEASFSVFLHDMGSRPSSDHSLERINNFHGYNPSNCKWALRREQANNKRNNHKITCNGETLTLAQWSRRTGVPPHTILSRIDRLGWSEQRALETSSRHMSSQLTEDQISELRQLRQGRGWTIEDLQDRFKCSQRTVFNYLRTA